MGNTDFSGAVWRKSLRSSAGAANCVELAHVADATAVRDSKNPEGAVLAFDHAAFGAFVSGLRAGRFGG